MALEPTNLDVPERAVEHVAQEARVAARGDSRVMLSLLQGAYLEEAIRIAIAEQPSEKQLSSIHAFCTVAAKNLLDAAQSYAAAELATDDRRALAAGRVHDAQEEARRFALFLRRRFETNPMTAAPDEVDTTDDIAALDAPAYE